MFLFPALATLVLVQAPDVVPAEGLGLQILWQAKSSAEMSNTAPGFKFNHPVTREPMCFARGKDLKPMLEKLPPLMKANGIWISTTNTFLYSPAEEKELEALVGLARSRKIPVFRCELGQQPGWKRIDRP